MGVAVLYCGSYAGIGRKPSSCSGTGDLNSVQVSKVAGTQLSGVKHSGLLVAHEESR